VRVRLEPGIELLGAVGLLGGAPAPPAARDAAYAAAWARELEPWRSHPAVALDGRMGRRDPDQFIRRELLLLRSAPPALAFDEGMSASRGEAERSGDWEPWLAALRGLARDSRFAERLQRLARPLRPELGALRRLAAASAHVAAIERYAGLPFEGRYRLVLSPFGGPGLNRVRLRDDGRREVLSVLPLDSFRGPGGAVTDEGLDATVWHELCHGVMDMTVDLHDYEHHLAPFSLGRGLDHDCRHWLHGLREHVVRAVMLRLIARRRGEEAALRQYRLEAFSAKPYLAAFVELLREYESSRRRYPTLADFYPRLRDAFPRPPRARAEPDADPEQALRRRAGPFYTRGQRARALRHLDRLLARRADGRLLERRAALHALLGREPGRD
jgi:hypothetical protein